MKIKMTGVSHHTAPVEVRERFAFGNGRLNEILLSWGQRFASCELVLLSTCNRTEIYIASDQELPADDEIFSFFYPDQVADLDDWKSVFRILEDSDAVEHLFSVAASLDSMVIGEPQILAQIKAAYQAAADCDTVGPITHSLFQSALKMAKKISVETELFHHHVSIPSIAVVDFALNLFERLDDKSTLVFGAGEMARETLRYLVDNGASSITIANRSRDNAEELAREWKGNAVDWEDRFTSLESADLLIAATGAKDPVLTKEMFRSISVKRSRRPLFILDLALPRNIDPDVGNFPNVYLYSIDDLNEACRQNEKKRDREIPKAKRIIRLGTQHFLSDRRRRDSDEVICQLRQTWNGIKDAELKRLFNKCPNIDEKTESEICYSFERLVNKLLHPPMESLKDESDQDISGKLPEIIKRLFHLQKNDL